MYKLLGGKRERPRHSLTNNLIEYQKYFLKFSNLYSLSSTFENNKEVQDNKEVQEVRLLL